MIPKPVAYIYLIRNSVTGKVYVGATKLNIRTRFSTHMGSMKYNKPGINANMYNDYKMYGSGSFTVELIENIYDYGDVKEIEQYWIEKMKQKGICYNINDSAYSLWKSYIIEKP